MKLSQLMEGAPAQGKGPNWTEPANTARPCAGPAGSPPWHTCAPEGPVPEPGDLRRAGLSQSWPEPVPHRFLREYPHDELARQNGQLAGPRSVGRCADRREIPCTEGANAAELV